MHCLRVEKVLFRQVPFRNFFKIQVLLFFLAQASFANLVVDSTGTQVSLADLPSRVVSLAPSLGELAADLLAQDIQRIVGVSEYTDYPPALKKVMSVGPYHQFNLERVVSLKPDLVLATSDGNSKDQIQHLRELKIPVVVVQTGNFKEVAESIRLVSRALGRPKLGFEMAEDFSKSMQKFIMRGKGHSQIPVMLQVGDDPLVVVG